MFYPYRNQSVNLQCKLVDWFLHERNFGFTLVKLRSQCHQNGFFLIDSSKNPSNEVPTDVMSRKENTTKQFDWIHGSIDQSCVF